MQMHGLSCADMRIRRTADLELVRRLDAECLPGDEPADLEDRAWWVAWDGAEAVGYAGAKLREVENSVYLCRAGVLWKARGQGLQLKLIRARVAWARRIKAACAFTYVDRENPASGNNLIRAGFLMYEPTEDWAGGSGVDPVYFLKVI